MPVACAAWAITTMRVGHDGVIAGVGAVPFQHGEFGQMQIAALAVAEHAREFEDLCLAGGEQFLGGEFRRGAQVSRARACRRRVSVRSRGV